MNKIFIYIFNLTSKYILLNVLFITILVIFINLLEISKLIDSNTNAYYILFLSILKIPSIISETAPFVIVISIAFLFKYLISNNELITMRNLGYSILEIFKPIGICIFLFGLFILLIINPISAKFEREFNSLISKDFSDLYSIKIINSGMWIKNISDINEINFINISEINLDNMHANNVKILHTSTNLNKIILADKGIIEDKLFKLNQVRIYNISEDKFSKKDEFQLNLNFDKNNIIDSISNFKFIPFYKYREHIKNLKKFNLHSSEVSFFYLSEILKPFFLIIIGFTVMGFSGKFKRNENFFRVLFVSILIGFLIFLLKEIVVALATSINLSYIFAYFTIFFLPLLIGLYQVIKIESD